MKSLPVLLSLMLAGGLAVGCGQQDQKSGGAPASSAPAAADTHTHADASTHAGHSHSDSTASHSHGHSHGGKVVALGVQEVHGLKLTAKREGEVVAGKEAVFLLEASAAVGAVRVWVGDEQGTNAVRARAEGGPTSFHAHVMVPSPLGEGAQLWVEVQATAGERRAVAFGLAGDAHTHDDHSHDHGAHGHSH